MNYFSGITDIEQAKLRYRKLAKQLHPDKGGTAIDFQEMQAEYKEYLLSLQQEHQVVTPSQKNTAVENELISELRKLAKVLLKNQVPQSFLRKKMQTTESPLNRELLFGIVKILDEL